MPKNKRRCCAMCKPHKRGGAPRDTDRQRMEAREADREIRDYADPTIWPLTMAYLRSLPRNEETDPFDDVDPLA